MRSFVTASPRGAAFSLAVLLGLAFLAPLSATAQDEAPDLKLLRADSDVLRRVLFYRMSLRLRENSGSERASGAESQSPQPPFGRSPVREVESTYLPGYGLLLMVELRKSPEPPAKPSEDLWTRFEQDVASGRSFWESAATPTAPPSDPHSYRFTLEEVAEEAVRVMAEFGPRVRGMAPSDRMAVAVNLTEGPSSLWKIWGQPSRNDRPGSSGSPSGPRASQPPDLTKSAHDLVALSDLASQAGDDRQAARYLALAMKIAPEDKEIGRRLERFHKEGKGGLIEAQLQKPPHAIAKPFPIEIHARGGDKPPTHMVITIPSGELSPARETPVTAEELARRVDIITY